jgi:hypothetical protein
MAAPIQTTKGASKIERIAVEMLLPYAKNSRTHSDEQVAQIAASIKEFGFNNPILIDKENTVIAGHGRLLAARRMGHDGGSLHQTRPPDRNPTESLCDCGQPAGA